MVFLRGPSILNMVGLQPPATLWLLGSAIPFGPFALSFLRALVAEEKADVPWVVLPLPSDSGQWMMCLKSPGSVGIVVPDLRTLFQVTRSSLLLLHLSSKASRLFFQQKTKSPAPRAIATLPRGGNDALGERELLTLLNYQSTCFWRAWFPASI